MASQDNKLAEIVGIILFALVMFYIFVIKPIIEWIKIHYIKSTIIILIIIALAVWILWIAIKRREENDKEEEIKETTRKKEKRAIAERRAKEIEEIIK
jgi:membrane protein implicated in regulation of membrane protease activity